MIYYPCPKARRRGLTPSDTPAPSTSGVMTYKTEQGKTKTEPSDNCQTNFFSVQRSLAGFRGGLTFILKLDLCVQRARACPMTQRQ
jgi:hypothetical protein